MDRYREVMVDCFVSQNRENCIQNLDELFRNTLHSITVKILE